MLILNIHLTPEKRLDVLLIIIYQHNKVQVLFKFKNISDIFKCLIGNSVKVGDGPAAVTPPWRQGALSVFVCHCLPNRMGRPLEG